MTKYFGRIGFMTTHEISPGVYEEVVSLRKYKGDVLKNYRRWDQTDQVNDDFNINNTLSIVADSFMYENIGTIRCVEWMGYFWKISSIDLQRPRIILTVGGVYNGPIEDRTSEDPGEDPGVEPGVFPTS